MTQHVDHPAVRRPYQKRFWIDGCSVDIGATHSTVEGEFSIYVAAHLPRWLEDGLIQGSQTGARKKFPGMQ